MTKLDLRHAGLNPLASKAISGTLQLIDITHLDVSNNYLTDKSCEYLCMALSSCPTIIKLVRAGYRVSPAGAGVVSCALYAVVCCILMRGHYNMLDHVG